MESYKERYFKQYTTRYLLRWFKWFTTQEDSFIMYNEINSENEIVYIITKADYREELSKRPHIPTKKEAKIIRQTKAKKN